VGDGVHGLSVAGALILMHRPRNRIGLVLSVVGACTLLDQHTQSRSVGSVWIATSAGRDAHLTATALDELGAIVPASHLGRHTGDGR
jgi:hypothetical protein